MASSRYMFRHYELKRLKKPCKFFNISQFEHDDIVTKTDNNNNNINTLFVLLFENLLSQTLTVHKRLHIFSTSFGSVVLARQTCSMNSRTACIPLHFRLQWRINERSRGVWDFTGKKCGEIKIV